MTTMAAWPLAAINQGLILFVVDVLMVVVFTMLPVKYELNLKTGVLVAIILALTLWLTNINGPVYGFITILQFLPVLLLIHLPYSYMKDLLDFTIKWYALLLIPSILIYWALFAVDLPAIGTFTHPGYLPYNNYLFYIEYTWNSGMFPRFNGFLLEPGHQALLGTFLSIAGRYRYRDDKWLIVLGICVIFSFSLAGYILYATGWILLQINSLGKALLASSLAAVLVIGALSYDSGNNAVNQLIIERLERDENNGIKGNNRFTQTTDFVYERAIKKGKGWTGIQNETNMSNVEGAGYKIFVIMKGFIGIILYLMFYIAVIPEHPDYRYTASFLIVLILCFLQRAAPEVYLWLFSYVSGIYLAKHEKEQLHTRPTA